MMIRRRFMGALAINAIAADLVHAQEAWPVRPVRLVVPWGAGGATDVLGRAIAEELRQELGQSVIVENQPGATGIIGAQRVSRAAPDGYSLLFSTNVQVINPAIRRSMPFDAVSGLTPILLLGYAPNVLVVRNDAPWKTYQEYAAAARNDPGGMTYATPGVGTSTHLAGEQFGQLTGAKFTNVPFNSTAAMAQSVLAGDVKSTWLPTLNAMPYVQARHMRSLGVASGKRSTFLPDAPTFGDLGMRNFVSESWWGLWGPAGLPEAITQRLVAAITTALAKAAVQERLRGAGLDRIAPVIGQEMRTLMVREIEQYRALVRAANIELID